MPSPYDIIRYSGTSIEQSKNLDLWMDIAPELAVIAYQIYRTEGQPGDVCPPKNLVFRALEMVAPQDVKVVVLGQDPYHTVGKASGLAFGYHPEYQGRTDSSLMNIMSELQNCYGGDCTLPGTDLISWAKQGVLLLNTRLTVQAGMPLSHSNRGWEVPVGKILQYLICSFGWYDLHENRPAFLLWGKEARDTARTAGLNLGDPGVVVTSHPCKYSCTAGPNPFLGSQCFRVVNQFLQDTGRNPIQWTQDGGIVHVK